MKTLRALGFFLAVSISATAQNYFLTTSRDGVEEVYIMSVTSNRSSTSLVVFDRIKPAEGKLQDFRHNVAKTADKTQVDIDKLDKVGYYRRKIQYNCANKSYRIMEITYNELSGKELGKAEYDEKETEWRKVFPGSIIDVEFQKVCKK